MGTAVPLLTARVWVLCGESVVKIGTGLLSAGNGVRRGVLPLEHCVGFSLKRKG